MIKGKSSRLILVLCLSLSLDGLARSYTVQSGDTMTNVAQIYFGTPVYGKAGGLKKLLALNPGLKNPNLILPGQRIEVSELEVRAAASTDTPVPLVAAEAPNTPAEVKVVPEPTFAVTSAELAPLADRYSQVEISALAYFSRLEGTDLGNSSKGSLISKLNTGVDLAWKQIWSDDLQTFQHIGLRNEDYLSNASSNISVEASAQKRTHLGFGMSWNFLKKFSLQGELMSQEEIYYRAPAGGQSILLESIAVPQARLGLNYRLADLAPFYFEAKLATRQGMAVSTAFYDVKPLAAYRAELELGQKFKGLSVSSGFFYESVRQDSSLLKIERTDMGLELLLKWSLGHEK